MERNNDVTEKERVLSLLPQQIVEKKNTQVELLVAAPVLALVVLHFFGDKDISPIWFAGIVVLAGLHVFLSESKREYVKPEKNDL